jgi:hypothetical protein
MRIELEQASTTRYYMQRVTIMATFVPEDNYDYVLNEYGVLDCLNLFVTRNLAFEVMGASMGVCKLSGAEGWEKFLWLFFDSKTIYKKHLIKNVFEISVREYADTWFNISSSKYFRYNYATETLSIMQIWEKCTVDDMYNIFMYNRIEAHIGDNESFGRLLLDIKTAQRIDRIDSMFAE